MLRAKRRTPNTQDKAHIEHTAFYPYLMRFLEHLTVKGYSPHTQTVYDKHIRYFVVWCDERGIQTPNEITKPVLDRYRKHLYYRRQDNGEPLSFTTQSLALRALKGYFRWLTRENYLLYNPASELDMPKAVRSLPRVILTVDQIGTIFNQPDITTPEGLRDRTILECFYSTGIRRMELTQLTAYDVNLSNGVLAVRRGKGGKDRMLPLSERMQQWLRRYVDDVRDQLRGPLDEDRLFITDYGEPYSSNMLGHMVKKHIRNAGLDVVGSCHLFRHAMATHMLDRGADIRFIQAMLGHTRLETTQIYTQVSVEKLRQIHAATHPIANHPTPNDQTR